MPIYEYRCASCGHELEALQKISEPPPLPGLDVGQSVQVETWHADGTARVVYRGTHWDGVAATKDTPHRHTMYIVGTRGSTLLLGAERPLGSEP